MEQKALGGNSVEFIKGKIEEAETSAEAYADSLKGKAKVLTTADYNWPVDNPASVALWLLEPGIYCKHDAGITAQYGTTSASGPTESLVTFVVDKNNTLAHILAYRASAYNALLFKSVVTNVTSGVIMRESNLDEVNDNLTSTATDRPLSANQGKILNDKIGGDLSNLTTTDKTSLINAINEVAGQGGGGVTELTTDDYNYPTDNPTGVALWLLEPGIYSAANNVRIYESTTSSFITGGTWIVADEGQDTYGIISMRYGAGSLYYFRVSSFSGAQLNMVKLPDIEQSTGTSQTSVMSQNAVTSMVYADPSAKRKIVIPNGSSASIGANGDILIGGGTVSGTGNGVGIGNGLLNIATGGIAIGYGARTGASAAYSIALGAGATATRREVNIGTGSQLWGYNDTSYRLLGGVHDPVDNHDAATKGYTDSAIASAIGGITSFDYQVVDTLPATGTKGIIYLVPVEESGAPFDNVFDEYLWFIDEEDSGDTGHFEIIGSTQVDLSDYVTNSALQAALSGYATTSDLNTGLAGKAEEPLTGSTAPTTSTQGTVGQLYKQSDGTVYILNEIVEEPGEPDSYVWVKVSSADQVQSDWSQSDNMAVDYIKNKPTVPAITMTTTDPGEGSALPADNYVAVYGGDPIILDYSTNEINTGAKWVDGSAIYKKTLVVSALSADGSYVTKNIDETGVSKILKFEGVMTDSGETGFWDISYRGVNVDAGVQRISIYNTSGLDFSTYKAYVTIYYTKSS